MATTTAAPARAVARGSGYWFSANPDKASAEKLFLAYTPVWMALFGVYQRSRIGDGLDLVTRSLTEAPYGG